LVNRFPSLSSLSLSPSLSRRALNYEDAARHAATHFASRTRGRGDAICSRTTTTTPKEEEFTGTVRGVSAAAMEKAKVDLPYGIPVPGRKGMVTSPYTPGEEKYVDVTGFASGSVVKDPYRGKLFLVP